MKRPGVRAAAHGPSITGAREKYVAMANPPTGARVAKFLGERRMRSALRFGVGTDKDFRRVLRNARKRERQTP